MVDKTVNLLPKIDTNLIKSHIRFFNVSSKVIVIIFIAAAYYN